MTTSLDGGRLSSRPPLERKAFTDAMSELASGVSLVTCLVGGRPWGTTVTAFQSVSADPPTVLVSLRTGTVAAEAIADDGRFWVNLLGRDHVALARDAATRGTPRFLPSPTVAGALAQLECEVTEAIEIADHTVFFGRVQSARSSGSGAALVHHRRAYDTVGGGTLELHLEKVLAVSPGRVFAAFVDGEQLRRWWGPSGFEVPRLEFDAVEGARYRIAMQPPDGAVFHLAGTFRLVDPPRRLAFTFAWEEPDPDDQETLVTVTVEPREAGTRLVVDQGSFKTEPRRELHRDGWTQTLERLERFLVE